MSDSFTEGFGQYLDRPSDSDVTFSPPPGRGEKQLVFKADIYDSVGKGVAAGTAAGLLATYITGFFQNDKKFDPSRWGEGFEWPKVK